MRQEPSGTSGSDGDVVVPLRRLRSHDGGRDHLDAVIVGGGTIGLACAWRAARRGLRVRVLERDQPGAGATSVAAGMLTPVGEANWGEDAIVSMSTASAPPVAEVRRGASSGDSGMESGYESRGALHVALDRDESEELRRRFDLMSLLGPWAWSGSARVSAASWSPGSRRSCTAGVHLPGGGRGGSAPAGARPSPPLWRRPVARCSLRPRWSTRSSRMTGSPGS